MQILAVFNAKGGVAKTTTTVNLGACFAALGARVLVIDLDYQGNATTSLGFADLPRVGSYDLITGQGSLEAVIQHTFVPGLAVVGATGNLAAVDVELALRNAQHDVLRRLLKPCADDFDLVLLDCPPAMGVLTLNALVSCSAVLIPSPPDPYAHDGLLRTWSLVTRIRGELNTDMALLGILPTLMPPKDDPRDDPDGTAATDVLALMRAEFGTRVAGDGIPRDDMLFSRAAADGVPACVYAPEAAASRAYLEVACQLLDPHSQDRLRLHRLDAAGPLGPALPRRGLSGLHASRRAALEAGLLGTASALPAVDPAAEAYSAWEEVPETPPPAPHPPARFRMAALAVAAALLSFALGWWAGGGGSG